MPFYVFVCINCVLLYLIPLHVSIAYCLALLYIYLSLYYEEINQCLMMSLLKELYDHAGTFYGATSW